MNKTLAKKAARIAEAAKVAGGMFVFPTRDTELLKAENASATLNRFKVAEHSCADCGTKFQAVAAQGLKHHCTACGSGNCVAGAEVKKLSIASDNDLSELTCKACGTHNILPQGVVASTDMLHCAACGHSMNYTVKANEDPMSEVPVSTEGDDLDDMDLIDVESAEEPAPTEVPTEPVMDSNETLFDDPGSTDDTSMADADEMPNNDPSLVGLPSDQAVPPSDSLQAPVECDSGEPTAPAVEHKEQEEPEHEPETVEVNLLDEINDTTGEMQLSFVYVGKSAHIMGNGQILASLSQDDAGDNAELMHTENFKQAVAHSIRTLGLKKAVANYGFKPAIVQVKLAREVAKRIEAGIKADKAKVTASLDGLKNDFQQSLDIAAAGFAANFWRNKVDPVKAAMITELSALGVRSAQKLVDRVFATHGVSQMREVLDKARELSTMPVEARNGFTQAINMSKYLPAVVKAEADEEDEDVKDDDGEDMDDEEATVATVAVPATRSVTAQTAETASYKTPVLQRLLGGKSFAN